MASTSNLRKATEALRDQVAFASYATDFLAQREKERILEQSGSSRQRMADAASLRVSEAMAELAAFPERFAGGLASASWADFEGCAEKVQPADALNPPWLRMYDMEMPGGLGTVPHVAPFLNEQHLEFVRGRLALPDLLPSVSGVLLRVLATTRPGDVQVRVFDPEGLGSSLSWLGPLVETGIAASPAVDTPGLLALLEEASADIATISSTILKGVHDSLADASAAEGRRVAPWKVILLLGNAEGHRSAEADRLLTRISREGIRHGIHLMRVRSQQEPQLAHSLVFGSAQPLDATKAQGGPDISSLAVQVIEAVGHYMATNAPATKTFTEVQQMASGHVLGVSKGIHLPVGIDAETGLPALASLNDQTPHAMLMGPSGTGKTEAIHTIAASVMSSYSPDDVQIMLLDMKETRDFTLRYGAFDGHPAAPHVPVLGSTHDVEYGEGLLRWLVDEMVRRNKQGGSNYAMLRETSTEPVPRILVIIDEFQNLFAASGPEKATVNSNVALLTRLAREARSAGIHLLLSTQTMSGIEPLLGAGRSILNQFQLRIALPRAIGVLDSLNLAAEDLPDFHAVINHAGGVKAGNTVARIIPPTTTEHAQLVARAVGEHPERTQQFFEGHALVDPTPALATIPEQSSTPVFFAGMSVALTPKPILLPLRRNPGGNVAVVGNREVDGNNTTEDVLLAGLVSLLATAGADAEFHIVPVHFETTDLAAQIRERAERLGREVTVHNRTDLTPLLARINGEVKSRSVTKATYVVLLGMDSGTNLLAEKDVETGVTGKAAFQDLLKNGPDYGVHTIAWWRQGVRISASVDLTTVGAFACWVGMSNQQDLGYFKVMDWNNPEHRILVCDQERMPKPVRAIPAGTMNKESV